MSAPTGTAARMGSAAVLALSVLLADCAGLARPPAPSVPAARPAVVHDLREVADLAARFDQDRNHPRVVLLLSPT